MGPHTATAVVLSESANAAGCPRPAEGEHASRFRRIRALLREGIYEVRADPSYPSLMLASRTTPLHFSISAITKARNSAGVFSRDSTLSCLRRSIMSGCRSTAFIPALSLSTIGAGVPAGANSPCHS
jgi:hypothetical protein